MIDPSGSLLRVVHMFLLEIVFFILKQYADGSVASELLIQSAL
jgi:hypothetical protein